MLTATPRAHLIEASRYYKEVWIFFLVLLVKLPSRLLYCGQ